MVKSTSRDPPLLEVSAGRRVVALLAPPLKGTTRTPLALSGSCVDPYGGRWLQSVWLVTAEVSAGSWFRSFLLDSGWRFIRPGLCSGLCGGFRMVVLVRHCLVVREVPSQRVRIWGGYMFRTWHLLASSLWCEVSRRSYGFDLRLFSCEDVTTLLLCRWLSLGTRGSACKSC
ncbi:hypothetical protein F2Q69_00028746 [Brassica cretica]|uniref:Uncharacterized protein n=1 Tax=Brassica cretica TaxID=69181 RepID=A0A8S9S2G9_BRACR|nr:hypothetical protein F2Q69_00028746 [Brassica cretica]